jgi:hypothetical protein
MTENEGSSIGAALAILTEANMKRATGQEGIPIRWSERSEPPPPRGGGSHRNLSSYEAPPQLLWFFLCPSLGF